MAIYKSQNESACRWRRRKAARPEEILDAALALFTEKGFSATRINDVAKKAGISKGTLYLYFDSKEAIFHAVVQEMFTPLLERNEDMMAHFQGSSEQLLKQLIRGWWDKVGKSRLSGIPKIIVSESGNFPELTAYFVDNVVKRARRLFTEAISRGMVAGEFRLLDPDAVARLVIAPLVHAVIWKHSLKPFDDEHGMDEYVDMHVDFMIRGLLKQQ